MGRTLGWRCRRNMSRSAHVVAGDRVYGAWDPGGRILDYTTAADTLTDALHLDRPPVGLAFVGAVPEAIPPLLHSAPSACSLWRSAEQQTFYAAANAHLNCPIGAMVMGFELPESTDRELSGLAELMVGCGYLRADEVSRIPTVKSARAGIVYGPLRDFPLRAELIVMWVSARDAMLYAEAAGSCAWDNVGSRRTARTTSLCCTSDCSAKRIPCVESRMHWDADVHGNKRPSAHGSAAGAGVGHVCCRACKNN